ncbi:unnamed protein product [marine sediment metagenome]|uniref:Uncharacterized protein n=1 Tax=marine sediment metagenome TaxID=412755 RepID=X1TGR4_9ZZZZ
MTPDEAIKRMTKDVTYLREKGRVYLADAEQLGIEALRRHKAQECCQVNVIVGPLPGETRE